MALDPLVEESIRAATEQSMQSLALSNKLTAWMKALVQGNEATDMESARRYLELIYDEVSLNEVNQVEVGF